MKPLSLRAARALLAVLLVAIVAAACTTVQPSPTVAPTGSLIAPAIERPVMPPGTYNIHGGHAPGTYNIHGGRVS